MASQQGIVEVSLEDAGGACYWWPLGECKFGEECQFDHHPNLDPKLRATRSNNFDVDNEPGTACTRCLHQGRLCDKKTRNRGGLDDPCSECRWFGGEKQECKLARDTSYNDQLWRVMKTRKRENYTLPPEKPRDALVGPNNKKHPPQPMPDHKLMVGWSGDSKDQLLAKLDWLPPYVRARPRAYLVPPRPSVLEQRAQEKKRKRESESNEPAPSRTTPAAYAASPNMPQSAYASASYTAPSTAAQSASTAPPLEPLGPPPPAFQQPPPNVQYGPVTVSRWTWSESKWTHHHEVNGASSNPPPSTVDPSDPTAPIGPPAPWFPRPAAHVEYGEVVHSAWAWTTSTWTHLHAMRRTFTTCPPSSLSHFQAHVARADLNRKYEGTRKASGSASTAGHGSSTLASTPLTKGLVGATTIPVRPVRSTEQPSIVQQEEATPQSTTPMVVDTEVPDADAADVDGPAGGAASNPESGADDDDDDDKISFGYVDSEPDLDPESSAEATDQHVADAPDDYDIDLE